MSKLFARFPWLDELDQMIASTMARLGVPFTRIGIGIVFLWFGALKLVPG